MELNPVWVGAGGDGIFTLDPATGARVPVPERHGIGISFDCPCGCDERVFCLFTPPLDGGSVLHGIVWERTGDTFETLTLRPSIQRVGGCKWHGFVTNGGVSSMEG